MNTLTTLKTLALPVAVALLAHSTGAFAAESLANGVKRRAPQGISTKLYACVDKAPDNPDAIGACLSAEKTAQDERLNRAYQTLSSKLNGKAKDALVSSEQAWQDFHTRTAALETAIYGKDKLDDLQRLENEVFRLSERANALDKYLAAKGQ
ncbi:lysozyme inhibitor LprI family protein [Ralstonia sp.]|uniref:lysozyme inhibitor LprI family protein n=1 Tax=Ralstonia sp. TaxID=54061 RepID=UPI002B8D634B|nr:lysozyme inhibitor LprI family protein [Ralstonia sp.]HWV05425.1 lysozyme inhibitor LprI family protein [Ralstonia sp.]